MQVVQIMAYLQRRTYFFVDVGISGVKNEFISLMRELGMGRKNIYK